MERNCGPGLMGTGSRGKTLVGLICGQTRWQQVLCQSCLEMMHFRNCILVVSFKCNCMKEICELKVSLKWSNAFVINQPVKCLFVCLFVCVLFCWFCCYYGLFVLIWGVGLGTGGWFSLSSSVV